MIPSRPPPQSRNLELLPLFFTLVWDVFYMSWLCCRGCTWHKMRRLWSLGCILHELSMLQRLYTERSCLIQSSQPLPFVQRTVYNELAMLQRILHCTACKVGEVMAVFYLSWLCCWGCAFSVQTAKAVTVNSLHFTTSKSVEVMDVFYMSWLCCKCCTLSVIYSMYDLQKLGNHGCI